jgi:peptide deformylase
MSERNSDTIIFDTSEAIKVQEPQQQIKIPLFKLVPETDPILREVMPEFDFENPPVDINQFASSMVETCKQFRGYGLSANQCGFRYRMFVMGAGDDYVAFFNPKILSTEGEEHMIEGCLSFPLLGLYITRPKFIEVEYQDYLGNKHQQRFSGISARCFQHELDHMNGIVYTDKVKPLALEQGIKKRKKMMKKFGIK